MPTKPTQSAADPESLTYEQAVEALESILEQIESGKVGLEDSIREYERGVGLIKRCRAILDQAEQRIEHLDAKRLEAQSNPESSGGAGLTD